MFFPSFCILLYIFELKPRVALSVPLGGHSTFNFPSVLSVLPVVKKGVWAGILVVRAWVFGATSSSGA